MTIAKTILQQLGGHRFVMMTGAKHLTDHGDALSMRIGRNCKGVNYVNVTLNGSDLYDLEFFRIRKGKLTTVSRETDMFNDQLQKSFTRNTGMETRLF